MQIYSVEGTTASIEDRKERNVSVCARSLHFDETYLSSKRLRNFRLSLVSHFGRAPSVIAAYIIRKTLHWLVILYVQLTNARISLPFKRFDGSNPAGDSKRLRLCCSSSHDSPDTNYVRQPTPSRKFLKAWMYRYYT